MCLSLLRDGETIEVQVTPQKSQDGTCRLGAWVRDNMQGIGTLTFVEPDGTFAALGHGISDIDTGKMLQLNGGELYLTQILSVIPGKAGVPGELQGVIHYEEKEPYRVSGGEYHLRYPRRSGQGKKQCTAAYRDGNCLPAGDRDGPGHRADVRGQYGRRV